MTNSFLSILKYWRSSVADSVIGDACLTGKEVEEFHSLSREEAETGYWDKRLSTFCLIPYPNMCCVSL